MLKKQTTFFTVNCAETFESANQWVQQVFYHEPLGAE
jgi:hypothetical protein